MARAGSSGWHAEVDHPTGGTQKLDIVGTPRILPRLDGLPRVEIPVERNDQKWQSSNYEGAAMRLWFDGRRQVCEEIINVKTVEDRGRSVTVLEGRDGSELLESATEAFTDTEVHSAAQTVLNNTSYAQSVDAPASTVTTGNDMQNPTTTAEFNALLPAATPAASDPWEVASDTVQFKGQTCWTSDAEDNDGGNMGVSNEFSNPAYSGGIALDYDANGLTATYQFTPQHDIPAADFEVFWREDDTGTGVPDMRITLNGSDRSEETLLTFNRALGSIRWVTGSIEPSWSAPGSDLSAGVTYTLKMESTSSATDSYFVDVIAPADTGGSRFTANYTLDNNNGGSSGSLDGPELYPEQVVVTFDLAEAVLSVSGGTVSVTMNDTSGSQKLELSNDRGVTWPGSASNSATLDHDFSSLGSSIRFRVTLSRYGSQSTTPKTGINGQNLQDYDLDADLDSTPVLGDQDYEDNIVDILNDLAEYGNFVWEVTRDSSGVTVHWTTPLQRTSDLDDPVRGFKAGKLLEDQYFKATIKGASQLQSGETFTSDHGNAVDLAQDDIVVGSEAVYDNSGNVYERGIDYTVTWQAGQITVLANGDMADSTSFNIDYRHRPVATYTSDNAPANPTELVRDAPAATTDRECGQIAANLVAAVEVPLYEVKVRLSRLDPGVTLVDAVALDEVPMGGDRAVVNDLEHTPEDVVLNLGTRQTVDELLRRYQRSLRRTAKKV